MVEIRNIQHCFDITTNTPANHQRVIQTDTKQQFIVLGDTIGFGSFSKVHVGKLVSTIDPSSVCIQIPNQFKDLQSVSLPHNTEFAIKCFEETPDEDEEDDGLHTIDQEIKALTKCNRSQYIASMYFYSNTGTSKFLVLEFCKGGDLLGKMNSEVSLSREEILRFLAQIAVALNHIHGQKILYNDLKPDNVCLDAAGNVKLVDFGLAQVLDETNYNPSTQRYEIISGGGTVLYCAPEVYRRVPRSYEADWWSYGIVAYELLSNEHPFEIDGSLDQQRNYILSDSAFGRNEIVSPGSPEEAFIAMFLQKDAKQRYGYHHEDSMHVILHDMFKDLDWYPLFRRQV